MCISFIKTDSNASWKPQETMPFIDFCSFGIGIKLICASSDPEGVEEFRWKIRNLKFTLAPLPSPGKRNAPGDPPPPGKKKPVLTERSTNSNPRHYF